MSKELIFSVGLICLYLYYLDKKGKMKEKNKEN